ncbi:hypothetical protein ACFRAQ_03555 [Nocardia sp. NPDC056611]|uniref:hypothetical protein n=1 Tax=Nocardia sp. NPDC056611 TaxID=3345877 RepID=UPI00366DBBAD
MGTRYQEASHEIQARGIGAGHGHSRGAFGAGVAAADPDDPGTAGTGPDSELCPYPDVNNPYCTSFPDDHNNEGDMGNGHDEGGVGGHR